MKQFIKNWNITHILTAVRHSLRLVFNRHQLVHTRVELYVCTGCHKILSLISNLQIHANIHTGLKPYICTDCSNSFTKACNLWLHWMVHTGVKPYSCTRCYKTFYWVIYINMTWKVSYMNEIILMYWLQQLIHSGW